MSIFEKWSWIKRNWPYIIEEATSLDLVFVGGTALNLILFDEYRASEDIDLYNTQTKSPEHNKGRDEAELIVELSNKLKAKGFTIHSHNSRMLLIGPNIKIEIFNDGTPYSKIEKKTVEGVPVLLFDMKTYAEMKLSALLCRTVYDPRDLVDIFIISIKGNVKLSFPKRECDRIENSFEERIKEIKRTKKEDLFLIQSLGQIESLPYIKFDEFKGWLIDWLSEFC